MGCDEHEEGAWLTTPKSENSRRMKHPHTRRHKHLALHPWIRRNLRRRLRIPQRRRPPKTGPSVRGDVERRSRDRIKDCIIEFIGRDGGAAGYAF